MTLASLPNLLCVFRMVLAVPVVWLLVHDHFGWTLVLFFVAAVTDGLDGYLAKRFDWTSELGKVLDPVADKLLLVSVVVTLTLLDLVPLWLAAIVVLRDLVIAIGAAVYQRLFGPLDGRPTWPSKINTVVQICYVLGVVGHAASPLLPAAVVTTLGAAVFVTTFVSGTDYVMIYIRKAVQVTRMRRAEA